MPLRPPCLRLAALLLAIPSAAVAAAPASVVADPPSQMDGDWLAVCDNLLECRAYGFGADDTPAVLVVVRDHGRPAAAMLILRADGPRPLAGVRLLAPRHGPVVTVRLLPGGAGTLRGALSAGEVGLLLPALRSGGRLLLLALAPPGGHPAARGAALGAIRLAGAAPALDWIEARQRRPPEALPSPPSSPAAPPAAPPDPRHPPTAVGALAAVRDCRRQDAEAPTDETVAVRLSATVSLWQIPCGSGNFDRATEFVLASPGHAAPARFGTPSGVPARPPGLLLNAQASPDGRELSADEPSRGLGDCGDTRTYRWDGIRYRLVLARLMPACRGLGPEDWPVVYRGTSPEPALSQP